MTVFGKLTRLSYDDKPSVSFAAAAGSTDTPLGLTNKTPEQAVRAPPSNHGTKASRVRMEYTQTWGHAIRQQEDTRTPVCSRTILDA